MGEIDLELVPTDARKKPALSASTWSLRVDSPRAAGCCLSYKNRPLRPRNFKPNLIRKEMQDTITPAKTPGPWAAGTPLPGLLAPAGPPSALSERLRLLSQDIVYPAELGPADTAFQ